MATPGSDTASIDGRPSSRDRLLGTRSTDRDPVLAALHAAEEAYQARQRDAERVTTALREAEAARDRARQQLAEARGEARTLGDRLASTEASLQHERQRAEHDRARGEQARRRAAELSDALSDLHRAMFSGNIYALLLQACLKLTGATRGLYVTVRSQDRNLRVRAAADVDGYPGAAPSEYVKALCFRVLNDPEQDGLLCNSDDDCSDLPRPAVKAEHFRSFIAIPVVVLKGLDGIIVAADRTEGPFTREHIEMLVAVGNQASVAMENHQLRQDLQHAYLTTITALADAVEAKDAYTGGHCERVARYAHRLGEELGLSERDLGVVFCGGLLHDVGKIGVSDGVLNKPGPLLPEERALVHSHVRVGHDIVSKVPMLREVAEAVLHHHEWYDGSGYPEGRSGPEIPLAARIVSIADAYSAMVDRRSYKEPLTPDRARAELARCAGTQFDPMLVEAFLRVLDRGDLHREEEDEVGFAPLLGLSPATLS